jgi:hypothetical protein
MSVIEERDEHEVANALGEAIAPIALERVGLKGTRPLVAFDVVARTTVQENKQRNRPERTTYELKGDGALYPAIDSAVKAAMHWNQAEYQTTPSGFATLNVPICVLLKPFVDVSIDDGTAAEPEERSIAFQTCTYPMFDPRYGRRRVTVFVVTQQRLADLIAALNMLFLDFRQRVRQELSNAFQRRVT